MTDDPFHPVAVDAKPPAARAAPRMTLAELTPITLWLNQFALGGKLLPPQVDDHLNGSTTSYRVLFCEEIDHLPG